MNMNMNIISSCGQAPSFIKLFKIAPQTDIEQPRTPIKEFINHGLIFVNANGELLHKVDSNIATAAKRLYSMEGKLFNETFYKSFATVRDADRVQLLVDKILHYMSTYGAERLGVNIPRYVPLQTLDLPEDSYQNGARFTVIKITSEEECITQLDNYLLNMTAPSSEIKDCITPLLCLTTLKTDDIKSFEIQVAKHAMDGTVPSNPLNQLRYLVYRTTGETLLIKNQYLCSKIRANSADYVAKNILDNCSLVELSTIFLRYKPIFLAFKVHLGCAPIINRLRRLADTYHKPLSRESLQNLTSLTDRVARNRILAKASNRELVKVLNSTYARLSVQEKCPSAYLVRNGRLFVKEDGLIPATTIVEQVSDAAFRELLYRIGPTLSKETFYFPSYIDYAVPTSEKQFIGNIPYGSTITIAPNDAFTVGVHWFNHKEGRTDIDLHLNSTTRHFGWNGSYREGAEILYTGDQTDAPLPNGAAEAYWFQPQEETFIVSANLYSGHPEAEFKLFMTKAKPSSTDCQNRNYTYDAKDALFTPIPMKFPENSSSINIGAFIDNEFFFYGGTLGSGIVPSANYQQFIEALKVQITSGCSLKKLLKVAGATVIENIEDIPNDKEFISLSPEDLTMETLFNIVDGKCS